MVYGTDLNTLTQIRKDAEQIAVLAAAIMARRRGMYDMVSHVPGVNPNLVNTLFDEIGIWEDVLKHAGRAAGWPPGRARLVSRVDAAELGPMPGSLSKMMEERAKSSEVARKTLTDAEWNQGALRQLAKQQKPGSKVAREFYDDAVSWNLICGSLSLATDVGSARINPSGARRGPRGSRSRG